MRLSAEHHTEMAASPSAPAAASDPTAPDVTFLSREFGAAIRSFFATVQRITHDNPVDVGRLQQLAAKARAGQLMGDETAEFEALRVQAARQGRAVGAVIGFFLRFKPYEAFEEIRKQGRLFQPPFGPVLVVEGDDVRELLTRDQEFSVEPYGVEMMKVMSPRHNGGFTTFILSTDQDAVYQPDKRLLTTVCNRHDGELITDLIHQECRRRLGAAIGAARRDGATTVDVVEGLARYVPVTVGHRYFGVTVAPGASAFQLTDDMLAYYGEPIGGQPETALTRDDGIIPDERVMYLWIKAAFQHFFNNVQKDPAVMAHGLRAARLLLAYLLREIDTQRERLLAGEPVDDTMLTRLVRFQLGQSGPTVTRPADLDARLVSDLRIAENVMGTIVGAVAGQEEATCRAIDSMLRLKEGEYRISGPAGYRYGSFEEATRLAHNVLNATDVTESRALLYKYFLEALRLQPQGEVLLRRCAKDGAVVAGGRPIAAGIPVFAAHGWAMKDIPEPDAFVLDRPREHYLQYGWNRHTCLGQYVSPVIIVESMIAVLGLQDLARPPARPDESSFPWERRFGRLQLDDQNLYATTFSLQFADTGTTRRFWPPMSAQ
jgi:hypothetical protein